MSHLAGVWVECNSSRWVVFDEIGVRVERVDLCFGSTGTGICDAQGEVAANAGLGMGVLACGSIICGVSGVADVARGGDFEPGNTLEDVAGRPFLTVLGNR